ncbi:MAG: hypothetical protein K2I06_07070 [Ruminococcus sp.]|nr:hypothetical protein [Ruminococcus sp.]
MITVTEHKRFIKYPDDEKTRVIVEIYTDDVSELPSADALTAMNLHRAVLPT